MDEAMDARLGPAATTFPLVGRDGEVAELHRLIEAARRGPVVLHLVGEPGLGKSRLLGVLAERAAARGLSVVRHAAGDLEQDVPFATLADALDARLARPDPSVPAPVGRRQTADDVRELLEARAAARGLLLALDDVHRADEASLDVLARLASRAPRGPVLLALAYRPRPARDILIASRRRLGGPPVAVMELAPLRASDVDALLPRVDRATRRELHDVSGGNPFYLELLVRHADRSPNTSLSAGTVLDAEVSRLPQAVRVVAEAAAVAGEPIEANVVAAAADLSEDDVLAALDVLVRSDICRPHGTGGQLRFRHPLVRQACYDAAGPGWRLAAHRRVAVALARAGAPVTARAHHVERCARTGDRKAAQLLADAAGSVERYAPGAAAHWYAEALRLVPAAPPAERGTLELSRAMALAAAGRIADSREAAHAAMALLDSGGPLRGPAVAHAAMTELLLGRYEEASALLRRELDALPDRTGPAAATLRVGLAGVGLMQGAFTDAARWAGESLALLPRGGRAVSGPTAAGAHAVIAVARFVAGDVVEAGREARVTRELVDGLSDAELASHLEAAVWLGWVEMFLERYDDALRHLDRGLRIARGGAHQHLLTHLLVGHGSALKMRGDLRASARSFEDAVDAAERSGSSELLTMALAMRCRTATWTGDLTLALDVGADAVRTAGDTRDWFAAVAGAVLGQAQLAAGRAAEASATILAAGGGPLLAAFDPATRPDWYEVLTAAAVAAGDLTSARTWAGCAADCARDLASLRGPAAFAHLAEARVALACGDLPTAVHRAGLATEALEALGNVLDAARARLVAGAAYAAAGDRADAIEALRQAEQAFASCGAERLRDTAVADLRRLGHRVPRGRTRSAAAGPTRTTADGGALSVLSARERQVAAYVSDGRTNREIAAELFVSEKTIEAHLSHIFTKLGVASRAALAALVASGTLTE